MRKPLSHCLLSFTVTHGPCRKTLQGLLVSHMQAAVSAPAPDDTPDWHLVQSLYLQGKTPKEIEALIGVKAGRISVMANRKGWTRALSASKPMVKVEISQTQEEKQDSAIGKQSEAVRKALGRDLERVCTLLEAKPPSSLFGALKRQQDMESLVRNAKTVFGWSDSSSQPSVRISILGDATFQRQVEPSQAIDVASTPVLSPPSD